MAFTSRQVLTAALLNDLSITTLTTTGTVTVGAFTLPATDGSADQVLVTNGSGTVTWQDAAGGSPGGSDGQIQYNNGSAFGGASGLYYDDVNNRVGIGTTSPDDPLHVVGDVTIEVSDDGSAAQPELTLHRESSSPADADYLGQVKFSGKNDNSQTVNYAKITGKISDASDTTEDGLLEIANIKAGSQSIGYRFTSTDLKLINSRGLQVDGDVGIGNTSPAHKLDVTGTGRFTSTLTIGAFTLPATDGTADQVLVTDGSGSVTWQDQSGGGGGSPGGSDGQVQYNNGGAFGGASSLYYDDANNRVGIGTTSPDTSFQVDGAVTIKSTAGVGNTHLPFTDGRFYYTADPETGGVGDHVFRHYSGGSYVEQMRILENGNVGIGNTAPAGKLVVEGDIYFQNNALVTSNAGTTNIDHIWHDDGSNTWNFCSDTSYKATGNSTLQAATVNASSTVNLGSALHLTQVDTDGSMRVQGNTGYIDIGPKNSTYCHIYTDRGSFYFNKSSLYAASTSRKIWHRGDLRGGALPVDVGSTGFGSISHGLGATPDFAFVGARAKLSDDNDNQLSFPITSYNSSTITFRAYEINGDGNSNYTSSTIFNATVYVFWMAGNQ